MVVFGFLLCLLASAPDRVVGRPTHAAFFVRYLLDGEAGALGPGFHAFLNSIATGGPATAEALRKNLGRTWLELESGFGRWIQDQAL